MPGHINLYAWTYIEWDRMRREPKEPPWVRWYTEKGGELVEAPWMTLTILRVFFQLVKGIRTNGSTTTTQKMMTDATGIKQPNISQALGVLLREGIITQPQRGGRYYLSIDYVYRGDKTQLPFVRKNERARQEGQRYGKSLSESARRRGGRDPGAAVGRSAGALSLLPVPRGGAR